MKKSISWLCAIVGVMILHSAPAAMGASWYEETTSYPSHVVLSHAFPSNEEYAWSLDFSGRTSEANDWMVRSMSADTDSGGMGFGQIPYGGFGVTRQQAYQAVVGSTAGTAMAAWSDIAYAYADHFYPTSGDSWSRNTLWEKIKFTLDGQYILCPAYYGSSWVGFVRGTQYLYNLNTITGVGFASSVDSAIMNVSGVTNQIIGNRLRELRTAGRVNAGNFDTPAALNRFWASPFVTVHDEDERGGYAPYRYKATGGAIGYDQAFGSFTLGGAAFYSRGRYTDKWSWGSGKNASDHYGLSVYGNWYATEKLFVDAHAGYQHSRNSIRRELFGAGGDWLGTKNSTATWWIGGRVGYDFGFWNNFTVTPSIGLEYRRAGNNGFTVRDSVGTPFMEVDAMQRRRFFMPADLSVQYRLDMTDAFSMTLRAGGGYTHDFSNKGTEGTMRYAGMSRPVAIRGGKPGADEWNAHLGAQFNIRDRWEFGVEYRHEGSGSYGYTGSFGVNF